MPDWPRASRAHQPGRTLGVFVDGGVPCAALHASEAVIYGRFGYGVATTVRAALSARRFHGEGRVVIEVSDPLLPANSGRYALSRDGVIDTDEPPLLRAGVDALAMMYLGTWQASSLVGAGVVEVVDPAAVAVAERLLATDVPAWCGTFF